MNTAMICRPSGHHQLSLITRWLPEPLRLLAAEPVVETAAEPDEDDVALPEFLAGDEEDLAADTADDSATLVAAE